MHCGLQGWEVNIQYYIPAGVIAVYTTKGGSNFEGKSLDGSGIPK